MKYSVIDISSSSLSLTVAETDGNPDTTEIVFKDRANLSLPYYLVGDKLSARGIDKLLDALAVAKEKCSKLGVNACWLISTAAMRSISNFDEVAAAVEEHTGLRINFLDGGTEAYCDYIANRRYAACDRAVLVDLGGKSIEICDLSKSEKSDMLCLDFGIMDLHHKFVSRLQPTEGEADDVKKYVKSKFDDAGLPCGDTFATVVLVGATNRAVYDVYAEYAGESAEDGVMTIDRKKFKKMVKYLLTDAERSGLILKTAPEKLSFVIPAAIVLKTLFKRFGADNIVVSDSGVKEGYLRLVLDGSESGEYYDFISALAVAASAPAAPKKRGRKPGAKSASKKTPAKRGRKPAAGNAAPKKRGRKPKAADETAAADVAAAEEAQTAAEENASPAE